MNLKEIKDLVDLMTQKGITEFELERSGVRLRIKRGFNAEPQVSVQGGHAEPPALAAHSGSVSAQLPPAATPAAVAPAAVAEARAEDLHVVKAPIVGTFYASPAPDAAPFVKVGERVEVGQVLCIIEAMKLMNEIESDVAGEILKRYVENSQPVEYGELLFAIRPGKGKK